MSDADFEHCDGRVGAVVGNGEWFVTSPNMDFVPLPPFGRNRNMRIRTNFRYGKDDPLQWAQPYLASDCHLGAIPLRPGPDDPMSIMWWIPEPSDLVPCRTNTIAGLCLISPNRFTRLRQMVTQLCSRAEEYMSKEKSEVIPSFLTVVTQGVKRLETLPMSPRQVFMNVSYLQRCSLELLAALDYLELFRPRMRGIRPAARMVGLRMGVFTYDPVVVQDFMRAGLPVWFIRPYNVLHTAIINTVVNVRLPGDYLCLEDANPPFKTFFVDRADHPKRSFAFHSYLRSFFSYPNPFDVADETSTSDNPPTSTTAQASTPLVHRTAKSKPGHDQPCTYLLYLPCSTTNILIR